MFAISPDPPRILARFADRFGIDYPLLSDAGSSTIREFGILNTHIPEDHDWYGIPYPGMYMVDEQGRVFNRHFAADHAVRESVGDALQEGFEVEVDTDGLAAEIRTAHLSARAWFPSPTIRWGQLLVLTVEVELVPGLHVYGRPLPEGYVPVSLDLDGGEELAVEEVQYPPPRTLSFPAVGETLPAYDGRFRVKARCRGLASKGRIPVRAVLRYQACSDRECFLPEGLPFELELEVLSHDFERLE